MPGKKKKVLSGCRKSRSADLELIALDLNKLSNQRDLLDGERRKCRKLEKGDEVTGFTSKRVNFKHLG